MSKCAARLLKTVLLAWLSVAFPDSPLPLYGQSYNYHHYTVDDGLPTNYVYGGLQDSRGYIWFYTEKGLARFDGYEFKTFTVEDGLPTNDAWMLVEDSRGRMWVGCFGEKIVAIDGDSILTIARNERPYFSGFSLKKVEEQIYFDHPAEYGKIIVEHQQRYDTVYTEVFRKYLRKAYEGGYYHSAYKLPDNRRLFFLHQPPRAHILDGQNASMEELKFPSLSESLINTLRHQPHNSSIFWRGKLYIAPKNDSMIFEFDLKRERIRRLNTNPLLGGESRYHSFQVQGELLFFQSNRGLLALDSAFQLAHKHIVERPVPHMKPFMDRERNLWLPTRGEGVYLLTAQSLRTKVIPVKGGGSKALCELAFEPGGNIYAGSQDGAVYALNGDHLALAVPPPENSMNDIRRVRKLIFTEEGGLWLARQSKGLYFFPSLEEDGIPFRQITKQSNVRSLNNTEKDCPLCWRVAPEYELYIKDLAYHAPTRRLYAARRIYSFIFHADPESEPDLHILSKERNHTSLFAEDGTLWVGLTQGLARYQNGHYEKLATNSPIDERVILCLEEDPWGRVWVGTDGAGLFVEHNNAFSPVASTNGLMVQDLCFFGNKAWAATNKGVWQIAVDPKGKSNILEEVYTTNHGLPSIEIMAVEADSSHLYAATNNGLAQIKLYKSFQDSSAIPLRINQLLVNGKAMPVDSVYRLRHDQNEIQIDFTALSYKSTGNINYYYRLENADRQTLKTRNQQVRYSGLRPGSYTFRLFAEDIEQRLSRVEKLQFIIAPPWWQTTEAWLVGFGGLSLLGWLFYRWRIHQVRQRTEQETSVNKQFAELELKALQSQMNPHFVFNALGAIQYFIQINEKQSADLYLSKFATLMRLFLESSKNKYLNLAQELKLLRLYVELEQLRFRHRFDFEVEVDTSINQYTRLVPTMLLQPFVENAINHGLFHKKAKGKLHLSIIPGDQGSIRCVLTDDGVGREKAATLRRQLKRGHRPRAMQITQERLHALSTIEGYKIDIEVSDLKAASGSAKGTRVVIKIPEIE